MPAISWIQLEKYTRAYLHKPGKDSAENLDKYLQKGEDFIQKITRFFVRNYEELAEASALFCQSQEGTYPEIACEFDEESKQFKISLPAVLKFAEACAEAKSLLTTAEGRGNGNMSIYRLNAFKAELRKLPSQLLMLLLLFQAEGKVLEVAKVEQHRNATKREISSVDLEYLNLLWGFRRLERVYLQLHGKELRADYEFTWYEAEWAIGNR